eukprot:262543-Chlamydomonas_euryale.AAC.10
MRAIRKACSSSIRGGVPLPLLLLLLLLLHGRCCCCCRSSTTAAHGGSTPVSPCLTELPYVAARHRTSRGAVLPLLAAAASAEQLLSLPSPVRPGRTCERAAGHWREGRGFQTEEGPSSGSSASAS